MIQVVFTKKNGHYTGIKVSGHAYSDEPGKDLVCAAVSTLSQTLVNAVEEIGNINSQNIALSIRDGFLEMSIKDSDANEWVDIVFKTIEIGIIGIEETYPQYVKHRNKEVHGNVKNI